jgi:uncharacterized membrane protein
MPGTERAELIFIAAMMVLILILCVVAVYLFFKTYKREMREREVQRQKKAAERTAEQEKK